jgi:hypothetical protein
MLQVVSKTDDSTNFFSQIQQWRTASECHRSWRNKETIGNTHGKHQLFAERKRLHIK